ncbi:ATPase, T2SS/T4P/T4SS family [Paraliobacillus ryukyuensis]|uniref:ATPase, T2SS/T4P/T4SS family n=1 Tax=Paraliobacillus ryukyuensis TaxID=200904 RepID=UPI0009A87EED|nr:ATPase, T2SS/T4P/T4SS family [Paraliobacillus ryukyuensis]
MSVYTPDQLVLHETIEDIKLRIKVNHADLYQSSYSDPDAREALKRIVFEDHKKLLNTEEKLEYVMREIVGLSFMEYYKEDKRITDVGYDGDKLIVQGNGIKKFSIEGISENEILKLISKFSNTTGKELNSKNSVLNTSKDFMRLNAVHRENAINGTTMAIRITRPGLNLTEDNWSEFAPEYMLDFLKASIGARSNIYISGDTGAGKTELQKLMMSYIPFEERIALIETNKDLYAKENFPEKDIFYWVANETQSVDELISYAGLRSFPVWINVGEVLGKEVYQMLQGMLTGHKFITTLHSVNARAIPRRLLGMAKMGYQFDEKMFLEDIYSYSHLGWHNKISKRTGKRYLSEVVEYHSDFTTTTVFKQVETKNGLVDYVGKLSDEFFDRLEEFDIEYEGLPTNRRVIS